MTCSSKCILYILRYISESREIILYQTVRVTFISLQKCLHSAAAKLDMVQSVYEDTVFQNFTHTSDLFFNYHASWEMREQPVSCGMEVTWYIHFLYTVTRVFQFMAPLQIPSKKQKENEKQKTPPHRQTSSNIRLRDDDMDRYRPPACLKEEHTKCTTERELNTSGLQTQVGWNRWLFRNKYRNKAHMLSFFFRFWSV